MTPMTNPPAGATEEASAGLPQWAASALNGGGRHTPLVVHFSRDGELIAGEVVERGTGRPTKFSPKGSEYLDVRVEAGQLGDKPLKPDSWWRLHCGSRFLRDWIAAEDPQPGDRVAVRYCGRRNLPDGTNQHTYDAGVVKTEGGEIEW